MIDIILVTIIGQGFLPMVLLFWLWRGRCQRRSEWFLKTLAMAVYLALMAVVGVALLIPWYAPFAMTVLAAAASIAAWRRTAVGAAHGGRLRERFRLWAPGALAAFCLACLTWAVMGHFPPPGRNVSLTFPLKSGMFYVVNGGYSVLINPHMKALARESLQAYRGQSYALDIVKLNSFGLRARGLWPHELSRYEIFGEPVFSPCAGRVRYTESRLPDHAPPEFDRQNPAGNFVYLECGDAGILLAHLMQSSIAVKPGERLGQGQFLGRVGNSGYSTEPHLHIHAQQQGLGADFMSADPLALNIGGRYLVRSSRVKIE